ncbi:MAG: class I SAM-dependent RNA methyltransferase [Anaerolineaceae bacterium]|nr:class I SAM-dependent RNA methyltransferase [Anaerolineaceae bacterium]
MKMTEGDLPGKIIEVEIGNAIYGGSFVGRAADGKAVFVPFVLPGERAKVLVNEEKKNYARATLVELLESSPERISARCMHFGVCGGCHYQHLAYSSQLAVKRAVVADQFSRVGKFTNFVVNEVVRSPKEWNYRNTVQFHVSGAGKLGFQRSSSADTVEISECHLPLQAISDLWPLIELDPELQYNRVAIRAGSDGEVLMGLEGDLSALPELSLDFPLSVVLLGRDRDLVLSGEPTNRFMVRDAEFIVSARSFFQVNLNQAEAMVEYVLELMPWNKDMTVFDLYCGVGLFSRFIAPLVKELVGVELSESACNDYAANLDSFENTSLYVGAVEDILPGLEIVPDVVILDPPRAGLAPRALEALAKSKVKQIIYVSCDPTTLARDCRILVEKGYRLESIQPFDLFPQTYHVETVVWMSRLRE